VWSLQLWDPDTSSWLTTTSHETTVQRQKHKHMNVKRRTSKRLSNPSSTGGLGVHFEGHVQASFVTLMLTGGHGPCLPHWPITEVKLQGKIDGFDTDDFIAVSKGPGNSGERRLLGQIKHSITLTAGSAVFGEVLQAAWNDFRNPAVFTPDKDVIALITGPLNRTDLEASWVLNHARANPNDPSRFFRNVATANFSSTDKKKKLEAFRHHLNVANEGVVLTLDGQTGYAMKAKDRVVIRKSNTTFNLVQPTNRNYFDVLRNKLKWGR